MLPVCVKFKSMILVNFKTYPNSTGYNAINLANVINEVISDRSSEIVVCPQMLDLKDVVRILPNKVWAQHCDPHERGRATGWVPPEVLREIGITGVVLNHSEHKISKEELKKTVDRCNALGLETLIFVESVEEGLEVRPYYPDWIAFEPPELIASPDTSVSTAKQDEIGSIVEVIPDIPILVGAGVKSQEDVVTALNLGAKGIGVSSAVVLAQDPKTVLLNLSSGFTR